MTENAQRYPWDLVPRLARAEAVALTALARGLAAADHRTATEVSASLLGCSVLATHFELAGARRPNAHAAFVELSGDLPAVCEIPGTLAAWIVDRALGGDAKFVSSDAGLGVHDETARGVIAYVMTRLLHALPGNHQVHSVDTASLTLRTRLDHSRARCVVLMLLVESVPAPIHLWLLGPLAVRETRPRRTDTRLAAQLLFEHAVFSAQLLATLRIRTNTATTLLIDDVLMLQASGITATDDGYQGAIKLAVLGARTHCWIARANRDRLELQRRHTTENDRMTIGNIDSGDPSTTEALTAVTDAPLEVSVEIARFTLPLGEIASLAAGDVLLTGRPIGEHVTLRAGSRAIATGELVNVEGAIGVRIVALAGS